MPILFHSRRLHYLSRALFAIALLFRGALLTAADGNEFFESKVRPLLAEHCYKCHSASSDKLKGDLQLDYRDGLLKGGKDGPAVIAGNLDKSLLIRAVRYTDATLQMPPDKKLSDAQIADLETWVKIGAPDPRIAKPAGVASAGAGGHGIGLVEGRKWWSFQKPVDPAAPTVKNAGWSRTSLDPFVLAKIEEKGRTPAPEADRRTLIRRAYFDLLGVPPAPSDIDVFVSDPDPKAYEKLIDKLLASPLYGQRWARHWLDVVRFTDRLDARSGEVDLNESYRYRDWVVDAFNADLPYDQFVRNQIAGDLFPPPAGKKINATGLIATGVYAIGEWGYGDADKEKMLTDIVDDQIDLTGRGFLGLTLACARCHDHKFDPILTRDYYGLAGIFFSSHIIDGVGPKGAGTPTAFVPLLDPSEVQEKTQAEGQIAEVQKRIGQYIDEQFGVLARSVVSQSDQYLLAAVEFKRAGSAKPAPIPLSQFASSRQLNAYALQQWLNTLGGGTSEMKLLSSPVRSHQGITALNGWKGQGADLPLLLVNAAPVVQRFTTITMPPSSVAVHPSPAAGVAVGWKSPIAGNVRISGSVADADGNCGDGIDWSILLRTSQSRGELAAGSIANGSSQPCTEGANAGRLASVTVRAGDVVQFGVYPKAEYSCDTTVIELQVTELDGAKRTWNLSHELVPDVLANGAGNPHADALGNAGVWCFYDLAGEPKAGPVVAGSTLAAWVQSASHESDAKVLALGAAGVRDALLAAAKSKAPVTDPDTQLYQALTDPKGAFWAGARADLNNLPQAARDELAKMNTEIARLQQVASKAVPTTHGFREGGTPGSAYVGFKDSPVMIRGRYDRLAEIVPRSLPRVIAGDEAQQSRIPDGTSGRMQLANWVASAENPLTARVMVNRIWQHHFGQGIVRTPNNFGKLGTPPTHPELLDHLAVEFVRSGWSIKAMQRLIMNSATYRQTSAIAPDLAKADPENLLYGHYNRQRLEAEPLRDSMLAVAGTLDTAAGGPAIASLTTTRRTIYVQTIRSDRSNYRMLFDAPDPVSIAEKRIESTVAPQALFLMNSPLVLEQSRQLAIKAIALGGDDAKKINWLYSTLYGRPASSKELQVGQQLLKRSQAEPQADGKPAPPEEAMQEYCQVLLCANEFMFVD